MRFYRAVVNIQIVQGCDKGIFLKSRMIKKEFRSYKLWWFSWQRQQIIRLPEEIQKKITLHNLRCLVQVFLDYNATGHH